MVIIKHPKPCRDNFLSETYYLIIVIFFFFNVVYKFYWSLTML